MAQLGYLKGKAKKIINFLNDAIVITSFIYIYFLAGSLAFAETQSNWVFSTEWISYQKKNSSYHEQGQQVNLYLGTNEIVQIPETLNNKPVLRIGGSIGYSFVWNIFNRYQTNTNVRHVIVPTNTKVIGSGAFKNCSSLTNISLSTNVLKIEEEAFSMCQNLSSVKLLGVTEINAYAFSFCSKLKSVEFGTNLFILNDSAFAGCLSLTNINLPKGLGEIGIRAFSGCKSLKIISFPDTLS